METKTSDAVELMLHVSTDLIKLFAALSAATVSLKHFEQACAPRSCRNLLQAAVFTVFAASLVLSSSARLRLGCDTSFCREWVSNALAVFQSRFRKCSPLF